MIDKVFYLYVDYTNENPPRPFYVGKGSSGRVKRARRNKFHSNIWSEQISESKDVK